MQPTTAGTLIRPAPTAQPHVWAAPMLDATMLPRIMVYNP